MDDKKDAQEKNLKNIPVPERRTAAPAGSAEQVAESGEKKETKPEKSAERKEGLQNEQVISEGLKREIELMQIDDNLKKQAEQKASKIQLLADDDKLKELLRMAKEKGVFYAIQVCKKMNDPFLLDTLHDILAKEGYYQKFIK